jgi:hypothetical protein
VATRPEPDLTPDAHAGIGRLGVPVDETDGEIALPRRKDLDGQDVPVSRLRRPGYVDHEAAERAESLGGVSDLLAVEPDVGPVIDAVELQPDVACAGPGGDDEFPPVPPGDLERLGRDGFQVLADEDVGVSVVLDEGPHDRRGDGGRVPALDLEARLGNRLAARLDFFRGLEEPDVVKADGPVERASHHLRASALLRHALPASVLGEEKGYCQSRDQPGRQTGPANLPHKRRDRPAHDTSGRESKAFKYSKRFLGTSRCFHYINSAGSAKAAVIFPHPAQAAA